jgi:hypothetical protein
VTPTHSHSSDLPLNANALTISTDATGELLVKLCSAASPGEVLAVTDPAGLPNWVRSGGEVTVRIKGVGSVGGVHRLRVDTSAS